GLVEVLQRRCPGPVARGGELFVLLGPFLRPDGAHLVLGRLGLRRREGKCDDRNGEGQAAEHDFPPSSRPHATVLHLSVPPGGGGPWALWHCLRASNGTPDATPTPALPRHGGGRKRAAEHRDPGSLLGLADRLQRRLGHLPEGLLDVLALAVLGQ